MKPKIHAFNGRTGAGKTTVSKQFAKDINAYRISHDELLEIMYDRKQLEKEHSSCCDKTNQLAWKMIKDVTDLNIDVVIEGWGSRRLRDQVRTKAKKLNLEIEFYFVSCPQEERLQRIRRRNEDLKEDAPFISEEDFYRMEAIDEEFGEDEPFTEIVNIKHNQALQTTSASARRLS